MKAGTNTRIKQLEKTDEGKKGLIKVVSMKSLQEHYDNRDIPVQEIYVVGAGAHRRFQLDTLYKKVQAHKRRDARKIKEGTND